MKPVRYGIIGCGMMGQEHLRNIALLPDAEVVAVFEPDAGMRARAAALVPGAQFAGSLAGVLAVPDVNCLLIASPNHLHLGQLEEIAAIREVFGANVPPIAATKSLTGHSLGATGVQEAIYSMLMMNNRFICESAHINEIDPDFADLPIVRERIDNAEFDTVLSNSFGFGGTNATLVFQRLER